MSDTQTPAPAGASVTQINLPDHVITYKNKHGIELFAATGENVLSLVKTVRQESKRLSASLALLAAKPEEGGAAPAIRGHRWLWRALAEVVDQTAPEDCKALKRLFYGDAAHCVSIDPAWRTELLTWLVVNVPPALAEHSPRQLIVALAGSQELQPDELALTAQIYRSLQFLVPARARVGEVTFLSTGMLDDCREVRELLRDQWKAEAIADPARAHNVLGRYLRFLNDWASGDFDLVKVHSSSADFELEAF